MFGFLKKILRRSAPETPDADGPGLQLPSASPPPYHSSAVARSQPPQQNGRFIELPLQQILAGLPLELQPRVRQADPGSLTVSVPLEKILAQLSRGVVKVSFGELRQAVPGVFTSENDRDRVMVALPLAEILARLNPVLITRRRTQQKLHVPADIASPFEGSFFAYNPDQPSEPTPAAHPPRAMTPAPAAPVARNRGMISSVPSPVPPATLPLSPASRLPVNPPPPAAPAAPSPAPAPGIPAAGLPDSPIRFSPPPRRAQTPSSAQVPAPVNLQRANPAATEISTALTPKPAPVAKAAPVAPAVPSVPPSAKPAARAPAEPPVMPPPMPVSPAPSAAHPAPAAAVASKPVVSKPVAPAPVAPAASPAVPAKPAQTGEPVVLALSALAEGWPETVRKEIIESNLVDVQVALPASAIEQGLKQGRIAFSWKTVRSWFKPAVLATASPQDGLVLELPLKLVAPVFLTRQKPALKAHEKVAVDEEIPNLFFGNPQADNGSSAVTAPRTTDTNYYVWGDTSDTVLVHESEVKRGSTPGTKFVAKYATPNEVISRAAALDGVAGALIALPDGLMVANQLPPELNGDTLAAFLPQIFGKVSQCTKELRMGELNNLNFTVGNVPWKIFRVNAIYFAAFGRAGEPLPTAQLAALAAELDHKAK